MRKSECKWWLFPNCFPPTDIIHNLERTNDCCSSFAQYCLTWYKFTLDESNAESHQRAMWCLTTRQVLKLFEWKACIVMGSVERKRDFSETYWFVQNWSFRSELRIPISKILIRWAEPTLWQEWKMCKYHLFVCLLADVIGRRKRQLCRECEEQRAINTKQKRCKSADRPILVDITYPMELRNSVGSPIAMFTYDPFSIYLRFPRISWS